MIMDSSVIEATAFPLVDLTLARRLERAEAMANAASIDSRRAVQPDVGAEWTDVAGVYAMFDGLASPLTQTFGLGLFDAFGPREFEEIEEFFFRRGADVFHEVSAFVAPETLGLLGARGYRPIEASVVLIQPIVSHASTDASVEQVSVRAI